MKLEEIKSILEKNPGLATSLGIELISTEDESTCVACMKADGRTCQPFGYLSGGASLALAETLAGAGSYALSPNTVNVGMNVSGTHVRAVPMGDIVTATATILHIGSKIHQWQVRITDSDGQLVSDIQVTNYIIQK